MTPFRVGHARWHEHANGVNPPAGLRHWLTDTQSLTRKLIGCSDRFRVECLRQERSRCLPDEHTLVGLARPVQVQEREVLLHCDGKPVVYAHSVVPLSSTTADWPFFGTLGNRSLGTTLFGDPRVDRGRLQFARLCSRHPLVQRARTVLGTSGDLDAPLFARRCLYRRRRGLLLVTELFLPLIAELKIRRHPTPSYEYTR